MAQSSSTAYVPSAASFGFSVISFWLSLLHSQLHWRVIFTQGQLLEPARGHAVHVLDSLWLVKALARCTPRWPAVVALLAAGLAAGRAVMVE